MVFEKRDVFGDGVNIASRIQAIAPPSTIYISETVRNNIYNKSGISTRFVKQEHLKNVKAPIRIYEVLAPEPAQPSDDHPLQASPDHSIAVLPFVNMSNDPEQEYFRDGISEEIINALTQLNNLQVIARTSVFSFKGKNLDVREIGKSLNVKTLLEGSVRKAGSRVRISTQLLRVSDGSHIWSDRYDRDLENIFAVQEDIAGNVATSLRGYLTTEEKEVIRPYETVIEAYEYFLKGRQFLHRLILDQSREMFEKAIDMDPGYAPAYAGLSDVHSWLYEWVGGEEDDLEAAKRYSLKALDLAPQLAESHSSRGYVLFLSKQYDEAEKEFQEAIRINSNSYDAFYYYGRSSFSRGEIRKSADLFLKASEARQEDFQSLLLMSQSLTMVGDPLAKTYGLEGIKRAQKQLERNPNDRRALSLTPGYLYEHVDKQKALEMMNTGLQLYPENADILINAACLFARNGDTEKALSILEKAFGYGYGKRDWIAHDPDYDSLREEPRFIELLKKLK